jgi:hypothetical protein
LTIRIDDRWNRSGRLRERLLNLVAWIGLAPAVRKRVPGRSRGPSGIAAQQRRFALLRPRWRPTFRCGSEACRRVTARTRSPPSGAPDMRRHRRPALVPVAVLAFASTTPVTAQIATGDRFEPIDVFQLEWSADPRISPDGSRIVYVRSGYDVMSDRPTSAL